MILIIDDDVALARMLALVLARKGHLAAVCHHGQEGLARAEREVPDLILLDLHLPDQHGWGVLDALRRDQRTAAVPVIVISSQHVPRSEVAARHLAGYLPKPFAVPDLVQAVEDVLARGAAVPG